MSSLRLNLMELEAIAEALKTNTSVTEIYLFGNNIGDEGAKACCVVLRSLFHVSCVLQALLRTTFLKLDKYSCFLNLAGYVRKISRSIAEFDPSTQRIQGV